MELVQALTNFGPVAGTVFVVIIFVRFAATYMKNERCHREKLAQECHMVQQKATEATFQAIETMRQTSKMLNEVNITLIRMNGRPKQGG